MLEKNIYLILEELKLSKELMETSIKNLVNANMDQ